MGPYLFRFAVWLWLIYGWDTLGNECRFEAGPDVRAQVLVTCIFVFKWSRLIFVRRLSWTFRFNSELATWQFARPIWLIWIAVAALFWIAGSFVRGLFLWPRVYTCLKTEVFLMVHCVYVWPYLLGWVCHYFWKWGCPHHEVSIRSFLRVVSAERTDNQGGLLVVRFRHLIQVCSYVVDSVQKLFAWTWHCTLGSAVSILPFWRVKRLRLN